MARRRLVPALGPQGLGEDLEASSRDAQAALDRLPGRKFVFTNGDAPYARRVLEAIGVHDRFHDLHESVPYLYTSTGTGPYNTSLDPVVIDRGRYRVPTRPGYSAQMRSGSLERYAFPDGAEWRDGGSSGGGRAARPLSETVSGRAAPA